MANIITSMTTINNNLNINIGMSNYEERYDDIYNENEYYEKTPLLSEGYKQNKAKILRTIEKHRNGSGVLSAIRIINKTVEDIQKPKYKQYVNDTEIEKNNITLRKLKMIQKMK